MLFLVIAAVLGLIVLANVAAASPQSDLTRLLYAILAVLDLFALGMALLFLSLTLLPWLNELDSGLSTSYTQSFVGPLLGASLWGLLVLWPAWRQWLARFTSLNPNSPVHTLALTLAGFLVANTTITLNQGGIEALAETADAASVGSLLLTGVALVAAAILGVGTWTRRSWQDVWARLGLRPLQRTDLLVILRWTPILILAEGLISLLLTLTNPEQLALLEEVNNAFLGDLDSLPEWLILGLASGIGEEILFRGAIQPAFGLIPTAALFAVMHTQYGFSPLMLFIFLLGLILGLIRQRYSTTSAILVHFTYNFVLGLLALLFA
jgi:membrane protease YdiL (CAAX protease family)